MKKETAEVNGSAIGKDNQTRLEALSKLININAISTIKNPFFNNLERAAKIGNIPHR